MLILDVLVYFLFWLRLWSSKGQFAFLALVALLYGDSGEWSANRKWERVVHISDGHTRQEGTESISDNMRLALVQVRLDVTPRNAFSSV
jgi:hypothetical protein